VSQNILEKKEKRGEREERGGERERESMYFALVR